MKLLQLSLRDLFWLVLVVALFLGWWGDHASLATQLWRQQQPANVKLNGVITSIDEMKDLVVIDLGSRDGLKKEDVGYVWHNGRPSGFVIVSNVGYRNASCRIEYRPGSMAIGDNVDITTGNPALRTLVSQRSGQ